MFVMILRIRGEYQKSISEREYIKKLCKMMILNNYCTEFMILRKLVMVSITIVYTILTHNFNFPFHFQDITFICWNL